MPRLVSFVLLVAIVLLVTALFFRVMAQFILPLFLAGVLVVVSRPLHLWIVDRCGGRQRLAAGVTTCLVLLIVLLPLVAIFWNAYLETMDLYATIRKGGLQEAMQQINERAAEIIAPLENMGFGKTQQAALRDNVAQALGNVALGGAQTVLGTLIGLLIMIVAMYYFLADGPSMLSTVMRLSPLDDRYELRLLDEFSNISRAVVLATVLSAIVQGLLAGFGFWMADTGGVFLLMTLTMLLAMVPFVGAAAVWVPVCLWLLLHEERTTAAVVLALYSGLIVSTIDNVIKPLVLHGHSRLHPLLALLSVLGAVATLGPIGILVGPMAVAFLQASLEMLGQELKEMEERKKLASAPAES